MGRNCWLAPGMRSDHRVMEVGTRSLLRVSISLDKVIHNPVHKLSTGLSTGVDNFSHSPKVIHSRRPQLWIRKFGSPPHNPRNCRCRTINYEVVEVDLSCPTGRKGASMAVHYVAWNESTLQFDGETVAQARAAAVQWIRAHSPGWGQIEDPAGWRRW